MFSELDKNLDEAEKLLDRALAVKPENAAFLDSIGWIYYRQGRFQEALVKVRHAATKMPKDAVILEHLAIYISPCTMSKKRFSIGSALPKWIRRTKN